MIVVDTQILVYFTTAGQYASLAERVFERDAEWVSTPLWRSEFRQAVAGSIRHGDLTLDSAVAAFSGAERALRGEVPPESEDVLRLVAQSRCSAYDLEFVALARALGVPLVTNDKQVLDAFPGVAVSPDQFVNAP